MSARTNYQLSLCHFAELTQCENCMLGIKSDIDHNHYCTHCGAAVTEYFVPPVAHFGQDFEVAIRRFKDSDLKYDAVYKIGQDWLDDYRRLFVNALKKQLDDGSPDVWEFSLETMRWHKNDAEVNGLIPPSSEASND
jgi:hypothetical protein